MAGTKHEATSLFARYETHYEDLGALPLFRWGLVSLFLFLFIYLFIYSFIYLLFIYLFIYSYLFIFLYSNDREC